jgi:hypothetical protein
MTEHPCPFCGISHANPDQVRLPDTTQALELDRPIKIVPVSGGKL